MWDFGDYNYLIFNTEIARRSSHMTQSLAKAHRSTSGAWSRCRCGSRAPCARVVRPTSWPAAIVVDADFDETAGNPYDFANMKCEYYDGEGGVTAGELLFADGSNPYYPNGLCTAPAINLSGRTPFECDTGGSSLADGNCPASDLHLHRRHHLRPAVRAGRHRAGLAGEPGEHPGLRQAAELLRVPRRQRCQLRYPRRHADLRTRSRPATSSAPTWTTSPGTTRWRSPRPTAASWTATSSCT